MIDLSTVRSRLTELEEAIDDYEIDQSYNNSAEVYRLSLELTKALRTSFPFRGYKWRRGWSEEESQFIAKYCDVLTDEHLADILGRSRATITKRRLSMGITKQEK